MIPIRYGILVLVTACGASEANDSGVTGGGGTTSADAASDSYVDAPARCFGAIGISKSAPEYAFCYPQAIGAEACGGLGCAKFPGIMAEDGQSTETGGFPVARCMNMGGQFTCTTQITYPPGSDR